MSIGIDLIAAERQRQIEQEGWTSEHDAEHQDLMAFAAVCYATPARYRRPITVDGSTFPPHEWPWEADAWKPTPDNRVRELVKAGALIAAEIDRLQRSEPTP